MKSKGFKLFLEKLTSKITYKNIMNAFAIFIILFIVMSLLPVALLARVSNKVSYGTDDRYRYERWLPNEYRNNIPNLEETINNPPFMSVPLVTHDIVCIEGYAYYLIAAYKMDKNGNYVLINNAIYPQFEFINGVAVPLICK